jgi:hypothetical protein
MTQAGGTKDAKKVPHTSSLIRKKAIGFDKIEKGI